jgi:hypothetical protein
LIGVLHLITKKIKFFLTSNDVSVQSNSNTAYGMLLLCNKILHKNETLFFGDYFNFDFVAEPAVHEDFHNDRVPVEETRVKLAAENCNLD